MSLPKKDEIVMAQFLKNFMKHSKNKLEYPDGYDRFIVAVDSWNNYIKNKK